MEKVSQLEAMTEQMIKNSNQDLKKKQKREIFRCFVEFLNFCTDFQQIKNMSIVTLDLMNMLDNKYKFDSLLDSEIDCRLLLDYTISYIYQIKFTMGKYES